METTTVDINHIIHAFLCAYVPCFLENRIFRQLRNTVISNKTYLRKIGKQTRQTLFSSHQEDTKMLRCEEISSDIGAGSNRQDFVA